MLSEYKGYTNIRQDTTNILYIKTKIVMFKTETNVRLMSQYIHEFVNGTFQYSVKSQIMYLIREFTKGRYF